jgi:hypothetical protein
LENLLEERLKNEEKKVFKANQLKNEIFIGNSEMLIKNEKKIRKERIEKLNKKIQSEINPFSFVEKDTEKFKNRLKSAEKILKSKEKFPQFKSNPMKIRSNLREEEIMKKKRRRKKKKRKKKSRKNVFK